VPALPVPRDDGITLPDGVRLAVRRVDAAAGRSRDAQAGGAVPFLLVHGLASNARLWDAVAARLASSGHDVVAVDLRSHGRSPQTADGHSTEAAAADVGAVCDALGWTGSRRPVVVGQSWGGNVALAFAAASSAGRREPRAAALACVDGGWIRLAERFPDFDECWRVLAPPVFDGMRWTDVRARIEAAHPDWSAQAVAATLDNLVQLPGGGVRARLPRGHHRAILRSMWAADPRRLYPLVTVPVLLMAAVAPPPGDAPKRSAVGEALEALPDAEVSWYVGADHDLHAQQPDRVAAELLALAARADNATRRALP